MKDTSCVVTGVAGFVGSHLAESLLKAGFRVVGIDNLSSGRLENMAPFADHPRFNFYKRNITEPGLLLGIAKDHPNMSCCFHLAAIVSVPYSIHHEQETLLVNHLATESLLKDAIELNMRRFVFAGSAAEYGEERRSPLFEHFVDDGTVQLSPYGVAKYRSTKAVSNSPIGVSLRFFNIYGPRQDPSSPYSGVISRFIDLAGDDKPMQIHGDGSQTRDFVHVSDCVAAYLAAAGLHPEFSPAPPGCYNIGTGRSTSIKELANLILELTGSKSSVQHTPPRDGDIAHSLADISKFHECTKWHAGTDVRTGLGDLWRSLV